MRPMILCSFVCLSLAVCHAAQPVGWRTDGAGTYRGVEPPTKWSAEVNVVWKTPLPNWSNASPIIVGDRIFICAEPTWLLCLSLKDGRVLWQKANDYDSILTDRQRAQAAENEKKAAAVRKEIDAAAKQLREAQDALKKAPNDAALKDNAERIKKRLELLRQSLPAAEPYRLPATQETNGYSSPTPTSDGRCVYVLFGTGVTACYDLDGNRAWARIIEKPTNGWGHSASPLLIGDKLFVHILGVTALDAKTGKTVWRQDSPTAWGSPIRARVAEADVLITPSGDIFRAADGLVVARKVSALEFCAPVLHEGVVYFPQHGGKAIALPDKADAAVKLTALWETKPHNDRYYASPVYHDGLLYAITRGSIFSVIDAKNGQVVYTKTLALGGGTVFASVTLAGKYLYISSDNGTTILLAPGREYKEVAKNTLEGFRSTPVFLGSRMYVRGLKHMVCIGK